MSTTVKRNRTVRTDLAWLMTFIGDPKALTLAPPRLELSHGGNGEVVPRSCMTSLPSRSWGEELMLRPRSRHS